MVSFGIVSRGRKNIFFGFVFAAVAAFILLSIRFVLPKDSGKPKNNLESAFLECAARSKDVFAYDCMRSNLDSLLGAFSVKEIAVALEEIFSSPAVTPEKYGSFTCHAVGHIVGELAIERGNDFVSASAECGRSCDYGCAHGALVAKVRDQEDFLGALGSFCNSYESSAIRREAVSCSHILGHGLGELLAGDARGAIVYCNKIREDGARNACGQGVIMEHFLGLPNEPRGKSLKLEEVLKFCKNLPGVYKKECYDNVGFYASRISKNETEALTICDQVPKDSKEACVFSLGSVVYFLHRNSPSDMNSYCNNFNETLKENCVQGAIETAVGEEDSFTYGKFLCETAGGDWRRECFSFLGDRLGWAKGVSYREKSCAQLPEEDKNSCLK